MLTRLLRSFLRPYIRQVAIVVILLVAQTIGNLYLPNPNWESARRYGSMPRVMDSSLMIGPS